MKLQNIWNSSKIVAQLLTGAQASSLAYIREDVINAVKVRLKSSLRLVRALRTLQARTLALQSGDVICLMQKPAR
jgi:hypothetical protein